MNRKIILYSSIIILLGFTTLKKEGILPFTYPDYWPKPYYDIDKNPVSESGFQLGRHLFYDPLLSRDNTISCASCHLQATGFTHVDHDLSHGIDDRIGKRNSQALMNLAWNKSFMWDGSINHIEVQALAPIEDPNEMDSNLQTIVHQLNQKKKYKTLFHNTFGDSIATGQRTLLAITQFVVMLTSYNSKYDKFIRKEKGGNLNEQETNGYALFNQLCASCHQAPLFTNQSFKNNGLAVDPTLLDWGKYNHTKNPADSLLFRVPTLRNIQFTKPYMHDGRFESLYEVLEHYSEGIHQSPTLSEEIRIIKPLTNKEKIDLVAFLKTLSDYEFLYDERFNYPRN